MRQINKYDSGYENSSYCFTIISPRSSNLNLCRPDFNLFIGVNWNVRLLNDKIFKDEHTRDCV